MLLLHNNNFKYRRFILKSVKGQLARDKMPLDNSFAPYSPIPLHLKIIKKKNKKLKNFVNK
jgi:hypothetical protein